LELASAGESGLDVGENVFWTYVHEEVRAGDDVLGLVAGTAEKQGSAGFLQALVKLLEGVDACAVQCGHIAQAEDNDVSELVEIARGFG
jgi:hypothetical protein